MRSSTTPPTSDRKRGEQEDAHDVPRRITGGLHSAMFLPFGGSPRRLLPAGGRTLPFPRQPCAGLRDDPHAAEPEAHDQYLRRCHAKHEKRRRQLAPHHRHGEDRDHDARLDDQLQRRCPVRESLRPSGTEDVEHDQNDRLDRDSAENVSHRQVHVVGERGTHRDDEFREVRDDCEQDEPAQRLSQFPPYREDVGRIRDVDAGDVHDRGRAEEHHREKGKRGTLQHPLTAS
nr:hypothetical protein [Haladaptatus sp. R4]